MVVKQVCYLAYTSLIRLMIHAQDFPQTFSSARRCRRIVAAGLIERALAIPARATNGSIRDVKHIVVLMQENRSVDHHFGVLNGVRGFGDPRPLRLPGGRTSLGAALQAAR